MYLLKNIEKNKKVFGNAGSNNMKTKSISEEFNNNGLIIENSKVSDS